MAQCLALFNKVRGMTLEEFNKLTDQQKKELLIDAKKLTEREDHIAKYEIFQIDNFLVEVSRSVTYKFRKIINTYSLNNIPRELAGLVYQQK